MSIRLPLPDQQIGFAFALLEARKSFLQQALAETVGKVSIALLDKQLAKLAPRKALAALAQSGLRGELLFAVPLLLEENPRLLAYYRLLLGYSQKEFFTTATGASAFKSCEASGRLTAVAAGQIDALCRALNEAAALLIAGVGTASLTRDLLADLSLLTLGPQLRGGSNNRRGSDAIERVFGIVRAIVKPSILAEDTKRIVIRNAAKREVIIEFAADPDLVIRERISADTQRNVVAIEIKGGTDYSNVHNRIGEAEKSHRKARAAGFTECWTIVNVSGLDMAMASKESPTTNRFYTLDALSRGSGTEYRDFSDRISALAGVRTRKLRKKQDKA